MEESLSYRFMCYVDNVVENPIGIEGMRILGKADWPLLTNIYHSTFSKTYCF